MRGRSLLSLLWEVGDIRALSCYTEFVQQSFCALLICSSAKSGSLNKAFAVKDLDRESTNGQSPCPSWGLYPLLRKIPRPKPGNFNHSPGFHSGYLHLLYHMMSSSHLAKNKLTTVDFMVPGNGRVELMEG